MGSEDVSPCGECGRNGMRIHRVYHGIKFCAACYKREFLLKQCSICGLSKRMLRRDNPPVCNSCQNRKPCIRCGKAEYKLGKITPEGPVCNSCSVYFRELQKCDRCGVLTQRLSRNSRFSTDERYCPKCATRDYENCPRCRKHRLLVTGEDGIRICAKCNKDGVSNCVACGKEIAAGIGKHCSDCYYHGLLEKRIQMNKALFRLEEMPILFSKFGNWLLEEVGPQKSAMTINKYTPFFRELEDRWGAIPAYPDLVTSFGVEGLRRLRIPVRWMQNSGLIEVDATLRQQESELRRIERMLDDIALRPQIHSTACGYRDDFPANVDAPEKRLKSLRLALRPAIDLLLQSKAYPPIQKDLDRYLRRCPGQRAALHGFVLWLNRREGLHLDPRLPNSKQASLRQRRLEKVMLSVLQAGLPSAKLNWLKLALQYFHPLSRQAVSGLDLSDFTKLEKGYELKLGETLYWIPDHPKITLFQSD